MAKVIPRKPISSLNRRFSVGVSKRTAVSWFLGKDKAASHRQRGRWSRGSPVEEHQEQDEYTKDQPVNNKDLECARLQITEQKADYGIPHQRGYGDTDQQRRKGQFHGARAVHPRQLRHFLERCARDQR